MLLRTTLILELPGKDLIEFRKNQNKLYEVTIKLLHTSQLQYVTFSSESIVQIEGAPEDASIQQMQFNLNASELNFSFET